MKFIVVLILASLFTFETERAFGNNSVAVFEYKDEAQPEDEVQTSVLTNSRGERYRPGTPSWVPLIDNCMIAGGTRSGCIEALPPKELDKLEAWEQRHSHWRRRSPTTGTFGADRK